MSAPRGRPSNEHLTERLLAQTRHLLAETGYEGTRLDAIAQAAETSKQALYRRWPDKLTLVRQALLHGLDRLQPPPPQRTNAASDLHRLMVFYEQDLFASDTGRAVLQVRSVVQLRSVPDRLNDEMTFAFRQALVGTMFEPDMETRIALLSALLWHRAERGRTSPLDTALYMVLGLSAPPAEDPFLAP